VKVGDTIKFTSTRVDDSGVTVRSGVKTGRIKKLLQDEAGMAFVVVRKRKAEIVLDTDVVQS
jgi:hypothetical protein